MKDLPNPQPIGALSTSPWDNRDFYRCAVGRAQRLALRGSTYSKCGAEPPAVEPAGVTCAVVVGTQSTMVGYALAK